MSELLFALWHTRRSPSGWGSIWEPGKQSVLPAGVCSWQGEIWASAAMWLIHDLQVPCPSTPLLSPGCYRVWLSSSLERCPGRRLWSLVFLDICHLVRKPQAACLVNKKWPLTVSSRATCSRRLTYFPDRVCALISGQGFTAASTSDLNQCRSAQARVAVAGWQGGSVPLPRGQGCASPWSLCLGCGGEWILTGWPRVCRKVYFMKNIADRLSALTHASPRVSEVCVIFPACSWKCIYTVRCPQAFGAAALAEDKPPLVGAGCM